MSSKKASAFGAEIGKEFGPGHLRGRRMTPREVVAAALEDAVAAVARLGHRLAGDEAPCECSVEPCDEIGEAAVLCPQCVLVDEASDLLSVAAEALERAHFYGPGAKFTSDQTGDPWPDCVCNDARYERGHMEVCPAFGLPPDRLF